jgi:hypothetical protein
MRRLTILIAAAVLGACSSKPAVIEVGGHTADAKAVAKRAAQERLLRPETTDGQALASIVEGWVAGEILTARGKGFSRDDLTKERARVETRFNDERYRAFMREVAKVYSSEEELYLQVGLLPDMAKNRAAEVFQDEAAGTNASREKAEALLTTLRAPGSDFAAAAATAGADARQIILTPAGDVRDDAGRLLKPFADKMEAETETAKKVYAIAQSAPDGETLGLVLRTPNGHLIAKRLKAEKDGIRLFAAVTPKLTIGAWLQTEAKALADAGRLKVCIRDEALRASYLQTTRFSLLNCPEK